MWPGGMVMRTFTIVTTDANSRLIELHDHRPVILEPQDWPTWVGEVAGDPAPLLRIGLGRKNDARCRPRPFAFRSALQNTDCTVAAHRGCAAVCIICRTRVPPQADSRAASAVGYTSMMTSTFHADR